MERGVEGASLPAPITVGQALQEGRGRLAAAGVPEAAADAEILLAHALGSDRLAVYRAPEQALEPARVVAYRGCLVQRERRVPVAYILGWREFHGRRFRVTPDVLVPRPETEHLVEAALEVLSRRRAPMRIAEVGTGSGVVAITLALEAPDCQVVATDVSEPALACARASALDLRARVEWRLGDRCAPLEGDSPLDLLVSNPPYVTAEELAAAEPELRHEPTLALLSRPEGWSFAAELLEEGARLVRPGGAVLLEIGAGCGPPIRDAAERTGAYRTVEVRRDHAGLDRVLVASRRGSEAPGTARGEGVST